eukprot:TRINITY_DN8692_c0_g1_i11.p1 TRINITY_DN8692_c0_g1~~TRINITY_DN8692_c0_g1_i11.p1  ORF type:complete len:205 (-),score=24.77 TRINITY_DN8692_c0_g1_i11:97-711(-)
MHIIRVMGILFALLYLLLEASLQREMTEDEKARELSDEIKTYAEATEDLQLLIKNETAEEKQARIMKISACYLITQAKFQEIKHELNTLLKNEEKAEAVHIKAVTNISEQCYKTITLEHASQALREAASGNSLKADNYVDIKADSKFFVERPQLSLEEYKVGILANFVFVLATVDADCIARERNDCHYCEGCYKSEYTTGYCTL